MLFKCSGKYIEIYFILKITFLPVFYRCTLGLLEKDTSEVLKIYRVDRRKTMFLEYFAKCSLVCQHTTHCVGVNSLFLN